MATAYNWNGLMGGAETSEAEAVRVRPATAERKASRLRTERHKPEIVEFCTVKRIDNTRLVRHIEPVKMRNLYKTAALGGLMALCCMFYVYQHFRCIDLSFQLEDLKNKQEQAAALNGELRLEISALRDPHRIDVIAQHQLGLKRPEPTQVREYGNLDGAQVAAMQVVRGSRP